MMTAPGEFGLVSRTLGRLPIMNVMVERLGLPALLVGALPGEDARLKLAPAVAIRLVRSSRPTLCTR